MGRDILSLIFGSFIGDIYDWFKQRKCNHTWSVFQIEECSKCGKIGADYETQ